MRFLQFICIGVFLALFAPPAFAPPENRDQMFVALCREFILLGQDEVYFISDSFERLTARASRCAYLHHQILELEEQLFEFENSRVVPGLLSRWFGRERRLLRQVRQAAEKKRDLEAELSTIDEYVRGYQAGADLLMFTYLLREVPLLLNDLPTLVGFDLRMKMRQLKSELTSAQESVEAFQRRVRASVPASATQRADKILRFIAADWKNDFGYLCRQLTSIYELAWEVGNAFMLMPEPLLDVYGQYFHYQGMALVQEITDPVRLLEEAPERLAKLIDLL